MTLKLALCSLLLVAFTGTAPCQTVDDNSGQARDLFGGFSWLLRNYTRGFQSGGMPGWQASFELPVSLGIPRASLAIDGAGNYEGNEVGANYDLHFLTAGPRFSRRLGRQTLFGKATVGFAHLNGPTGYALNSPNPTIPRLASNYTLAMTRVAVWTCGCQRGCDGAWRRTTSTQTSRRSTTRFTTFPIRTRVS